MKTASFLFSLGLSLLLVAMISCRKEQGNGIDEPVLQVPIDSGTYDPDSWLPLKFGARWEYLHDNGEMEIVTCGPRIYDTVTSGYGTKYGYHGHILSNSFKDKSLPQVEPMMMGRLSDFNHTGVLRALNIDCSKGSVTSTVIMDYSLGNLRFRPSFNSCSSGFPPMNYHVVCLDSNTAVTGHADVMMSMYGHVSGITPLIDTMWGDQFRVKEPFIFASEKPFCLSWWKRGIGLLRRDIYIDNKLVDRMRLVNYYFPD